MNDVKNILEKNSSFSNINLAIVCPMANERDNVELFVTDVIKECLPFHFKKLIFFVIVDDVSQDGTIPFLNKLAHRIPELMVIYAPDNRCVVDAYLRGYEEALKSKADWVLEIDAGFSHQPSDIPQFIYKMSEGFECVFGTRFSPEGRFDDKKKSRYIISRGGIILSNTLLGTKLSDMTGGFELFKADALKIILEENICSRGPFFQTFRNLSGKWSKRI